MKPKKILIALVVSLVASAIVLYFIKKSQDGKKDKNLTQNKTDSPMGAIELQDFPIVFNKKCGAAKLLQEVLGTEQDGIIGRQTLTAWQVYRPEVTERFKIANAAKLKAEIDFINNRAGN